MTKRFVFEGELVRREHGIVSVFADTPDEAKELVQLGDWEEVNTYSGETTFEWNGGKPIED